MGANPSMINVLIIGCGNIGAFYDWETDDIRTYAKAFHVSGVNLFVFDSNSDKSEKVGRRYGARILKRWDEIPPNTYEIVVISSPTSTHFSYLTSLLPNPPSLVICEKPVDLDFVRLTKLKAQYDKGRARVMVNFHRRFQPSMIALAKRVQKIEEQDRCQTAVVSYQRGFHNNASHAMDLLGLLFGKPFNPSEVALLNARRDEFVEDPTMTVACMWNGIQVIFVGLIGASFSHFEISLYFSKHAIELRQVCNVVEFFSAQAQTDAFYPDLRSDELWTDTLNDQMKKVAEHALWMVNDPSVEDNFLESIELSRTIVSLSKGKTS